MREISSISPSISVSVIVPIHDDDDEVEGCLSSLASQATNDLQVIVVDSGSSSSCAALISATAARFGFTHIRLPTNRGPGVARNAALDVATGVYVLFLDIDDAFVPGAIERLAETAQHLDLPDLVAFNWRPAGDTAATRLERRDAHVLSSRCATRRAYLRHQMDGSVVFTMFRREFLNAAGLRFRPGIHEDIDYIFSAYLQSTSTVYLDECLYVKKARPDSVTHTVSPTHIDDYLVAWSEVVREHENHPCTECGTDHAGDVAIGWVGVVASQARNVVRRTGDSRQRQSLLGHLTRAYLDLGIANRADPEAVAAYTTYSRIYGAFADAAASGDFSALVEIVEETEGRSWSCGDLQRSLFLAPTEVRTCCKRFYVDGERRGDVALTDVTIERGRPLPLMQIANSKRRLHQAINLGEPSACDGCPFLTFDNWPTNEFTDVSYLSMEQHSVCNLRCNYCDDTYFGGARPTYDVAATVEELATEGHLTRCHTVVWGGGEPVLDPAFPAMLNLVAASAPQANQRVLSNALRYSPEVAELMHDARAQLVTSVDAGTAPTFKLVRGRRGLDRVLDNLRTYTAYAPDRVTVKYILTDDNLETHELDSFVERVRFAALAPAVFQISCDFKADGLDLVRLERAVHLFNGLSDINPRFVFFDDLLQLRLNWSWDALGPTIKASFREPFYIWGTGQLTDALLDRPGFSDRWSIAGIADSNAERWGELHRSGYTIASPHKVVTSGLPVLPTAVQGMPQMLSSIQAAGIPRERLVRHLIL